MMKALALDGLLNIGEVIESLRPEFPDVSVSKIRFLETEQLLTPIRTAGGYRKFSQADVERLRYILRAQRERYLPLKVIRDELDAIDRGLQPASEGNGVRVPRALVVAGGTDSDDDDHRGTTLRLTRDELLRESGLSEELLQTIEQYGLVQIQDDGHYDIHALRVCACAFELTEFGIEARHLRQFKVAADREIGLVSAAVTPYLKRGNSGGRPRAHDMAREVAGLVLRLHASLLQSGLNAHLED